MEDPIRVLHVINKMQRAGTETMIMNLYRNIDRTKVQFDFMVHTEDEGAYDREIISLGGRIFRVPRLNGVNLFKYIRCWKKFFDEHPEILIVHGHMGSSAAVYLSIANSYNRYTITHSHSSNNKNIVYNIATYSLRYQAKFLFACSQDAGISRYGKREWIKRQGIVLNNAIDVNRFIFSSVTRDRLRKIHNCYNDFVIGSVGRFLKVKNHQFIIDIFNELNKKNRSSKLILIGEGELKQDIERKVDKLGLTDYVIFLGNIDNVNEYLSMMDVLLMPSLYEGLGIAVIEAQTSGLKCVISDAIPNEVDITGNVEFVSLNRSAQEWADILLKYNNSYKRKSMEEDIAKAGYNIHQTSKWLEDFYLSKCQNVIHSGKALH